MRPYLVGIKLLLDELSELHIAFPVTAKKKTNKGINS